MHLLSLPSNIWVVTSLAVMRELKSQVCVCVFVCSNSPQLLIFLPKFALMGFSTQKTLHSHCFVRWLQVPRPEQVFWHSSSREPEHGRKGMEYLPLGSTAHLLTPHLHSTQCILYISQKALVCSPIAYLAFIH